VLAVGAVFTLTGGLPVIAAGVVGVAYVGVNIVGGAIIGDVTTDKLLGPGASPVGQFLVGAGFAGFGLTIIHMVF
jgi:hypothetical protein